MSATCLHVVSLWGEIGPAALIMKPCPGAKKQKLSTAVKAQKAVPKNKACRMAVVEGLTTKTADMDKDAPTMPVDKKTKKNKKEKA